MKQLLERAVNLYLLFWARLVVRVRRPVIVGITGSVGKTSTTETIAAALSHPGAGAAVGEVRATPHNMNNTQGVPLVVLGYDRWPRSRGEFVRWLLAAPLRALWLATVRRYPKTMVLEFAAGPKGDIARTAALASPEVAVVTAIGPAHLEAFGSIERIAQEKSALVRQVPRRGLVVLGADNLQASQLDRLTRARVVKVGGRGRDFSENAARVIAGFLGVPSEAAERGLANRAPVPGRLNVIAAGAITVIDDSYNANPLSMQLGLDTLCARTPRRVAILGDMKELGHQAERYHREIGEYARGRADLVVGVGDLARLYAADRWFATSDDCVAALPGVIAPGDTVLVKASRSLELDRVVRALKQLAADAAA
jgi:UDP-N-acetylmuramoyl-tripeptide--D-alanyl-D-alanine ligase